MGKYFLVSPLTTKDAPTTIDFPITADRFEIRELTVVNGKLVVNGLGLNNVALKLDRDQRLIYVDTLRIPNHLPYMPDTIIFGAGLLSAQIVPNEQDTRQFTITALGWTAAEVKGFAEAQKQSLETKGYDISGYSSEPNALWYMVDFVVSLLQRLARIGA